MAPLTGAETQTCGGRSVVVVPGVRVWVEVVTAVAGDAGEPSLQIGAMALGRARTLSIGQDKVPMVLRQSPGLRVRIVCVTSIAGDAARPSCEIVSMTPLTERSTVSLRRFAMLCWGGPGGGMGKDGMTEGARDAGQPPLQVGAVTLGGTGGGPILQDPAPMICLLNPVSLMGVKGVARAAGRGALRLFRTLLVTVEARLPSIPKGPIAMRSGLGPSCFMREERWGRGASAWQSGWFFNLPGACLSLGTTGLKNSNGNEEAKPGQNEDASLKSPSHRFEVAEFPRTTHTL